MKKYAASSIIRYSSILMKGVAGFSVQGVTVQKAAMFTVTAARTSNFKKQRKGDGKFHHITGHEGPQREDRYSS